MAILGLAMTTLIAEEESRRQAFTQLVVIAGKFPDIIVAFAKAITEDTKPESYCLDNEPPKISSRQAIIDWLIQHQHGTAEDISMGILEHLRTRSSRPKHLVHVTLIQMEKKHIIGSVVNDQGKKVYSYTKWQLKSGEITNE